MLFRLISPFLSAVLIFFFFIPAVKSDSFVEQLRSDVLGKREKDPERNRRLANLLDRQGLPDDALIYYRKAAELDPHSMVYKRELARSLKNLNRTDEAIEIYQSLFDTDPKDGQTATDLASLLEENGKIEESESIYLRLISETKDPLIRLGQISQLADFAVRHQRIEQLINAISDESFIQDPGERALLLSQIYLQSRRFAEAFKVLEEELLREESDGKIPEQLLLDRLIDITQSTDDTTANIKYSRLRASLYPSGDNLKKAEESEQKYGESFDAKKEHYDAEPATFLNDLPNLLFDPKTRDNTLAFALSFIPKIPTEMIDEAFDGIPLLFREILSSRREYLESAIPLWKQLRSKLELLPGAERRKVELYEPLIGIPPEMGKLFSEEMTEDFINFLNEGVLWEGFWTSDGWKSLFETILESTNSEIISAKLNSGDNITAPTEDVLRANAILRLYQLDFSEQTHNLLRSIDLRSTRTESLCADWTLLNMMKNDPDPELQRDLAEAYRARIPLTLNTSAEHFVVSEYRKAAVRSGDNDLIRSAVDPILKRLERNFCLAAQTDSTGNVVTTDPKSNGICIVNVYEILNELLDDAAELDSLGLSKDVAVMYHRYGEGKEWWTNQEGQGVFYFEELKKIVSKSE